MAGEKDLNVLLRSMTATLVDGTFVFVTQSQRDVPARIPVKMRFEEEEGTTLIVLKSDAEAFGLPYEFSCRMITLNVHSALEAVGFIARVATTLAAAGMGVNPVSGFFHDHLFVPEGRESDAMAILTDLAQSS